MTIKDKKKLRVFIPTAGTGSRLGDLTENLNKSLIDVGNKPAISYIIDNFPENTEFVIALGFDSKKVKDFLTLTYPNKKFYFAYVDDFSSKNASLGYSMKCSRKYLQCPFFFIACDSVFLNKIDDQKKNWIGFSKIKNSGSRAYRKITFSKDFIVSDIYEKKIKKKKSFPYIGIASIVDYKIFWKGIDESSKNSKMLGEIYGLKKLCFNKNVYAKKLDWYDFGNLNSYKINKKKFENHNFNILPKKNETIWFIKDNVVKFSQDTDFIKKRVQRQKFLKGFTPEIINYKKNFFLYKKIEGIILSKKLNINNFRNLLNFLKIFWKKKKINKLYFEKKCNDFYKIKTRKRVSVFINKFKKEDKFNFINGKKVFRVNKELSKVNWKAISQGIPVNFHGDLHFENILLTKNKYFFLDWRQDFSGIKYCGDLYYDLAKLMHGIIIDHNKVTKNFYKINKINKSVRIKFDMNNININVLKYFEKWILKNNLNLNKVRVLTAIIYLNIAPLHHKPYSFFLFHLGKYLLSDIKNFENLKIK